MVLDPEIPSSMVDPGKWKVDIQKTNQGLTKIVMNVNLFKDEYLDWFWHQLRSEWKEHCGILLQLFPNVKEQTESISMLHFAEKYQALNQCLVFVIGDGTTPRTGSLLALRYPQSTVYSIDPLMKSDVYNILNLHSVTSTIEDFISKKDIQDLLSTNKKLCLLFPHSHANIYQTLSRLNKYKLEICVVSMPCCDKNAQTLTTLQEDELGFDTVEHCNDFNVHSEENEVFVWVKN